MRWAIVGVLLILSTRAAADADPRTLAVIGHTQEHPRLEGAGYALATAAAATLVFDIVAARRATRYRDRLRTTVTTDISGQPVLVFGIAL